MKLEGNVWSYGDNIDTDVIIPARYLNTAEPKELAVHCMEDIDPGFVAKVAHGDIMTAGRNFGCGSSREHAPVALRASGIVCVVAESFARIFYRNAINIGLPLIELPEAGEIRTGDRLRIDVANGTVENLTSGKVYQTEPLPEFIQQIAKAGGLISFVKGEG